MTIRFEGEREAVPGVIFYVECFSCPQQLNKVEALNQQVAIALANTHEALEKLTGSNHQIVVTGTKINLDPPKKPSSLY